MMLVLQIMAVLGVGMVLYAVFGILSPAKPDSSRKKKNENPLSPTIDTGKEQKIQRLQEKIAELEAQAEKNKAEYAQNSTAFSAAKDNEARLSDELKRRQEWVAKAEAELAKEKAENTDLSSKFIAKEKELQEEFAKNVNLSRQLGELKSSLEAKEIACRLKEDQIQAQSHQIENQLKTINAHLATIAEFGRKEKISEWVPKSEFNKLNEEYSALEKELEASTERLKSFAEEIAHLRKEVKYVVESKQPAEVEKIEEAKPAEEIKTEEIKQETEVEQVEEPKPTEEVKQAEEPKSTEEIKPEVEISQEAPKPVEEEKKDEPPEESGQKEEEK